MKNSISIFHRIKRRTFEVVLEENKAAQEPSEHHCEKKYCPYCGRKVE